MEKEILKEMSEHKKHVKLAKPSGGKYHRNEYALIGAPCDVISDMAGKIKVAISDKMSLGYMDAEHKEQLNSHDFDGLYTDKIVSHSLETKKNINSSFLNNFFSDFDALLINGNHFLGNRQIVFMNPKKKESLSRKLDRLSDIKMILVKESVEEIYDFINEILPQHKNFKIYKTSEIDKISEAIIAQYNSDIPMINGLLLAGGESRRMGEDKSQIAYHNRAQWKYAADLLNGLTVQNFVSCLPEHAEKYKGEYSLIFDHFIGLGPFGGILSAFRENPNSAWLSMACDQPLIDQEVLNELISARNPSKVATCFYNPETDFPEPLITIWEPRAYRIMLVFLSRGYSCPRKVLINSDIEMLKMKDPSKLFNVNDKDTQREALLQLAAKG